MVEKNGLNMPEPVSVAGVIHTGYGRPALIEDLKVDGRPDHDRAIAPAASDLNPNQTRR